MAGGEMESMGGARMERADGERRRDGETSPGISSRGRARSGDGSGPDLEAESPRRRRTAIRSPSEEYSDYSEEKEADRKHSRRDERVEKELDRGRERWRHESVKERTRSAVVGVELNSKDDRFGDRRKRERDFSSGDEDSEEDEVVEAGAKMERLKAERSRRHDSSEDGSEEEDIVGGTPARKSKSRIREKSGRRHGVSYDDGSDEDEVGTPTKKIRSGKHSDRKSSEKRKKHNDRKSGRKRRRRARSYSSDEDSSESDELSSSSSDVSETEDEVQREKERRRRKKARQKEREREQEKEIRRKDKRRVKELKEKKLKSQKKKEKREMRSKQPITTSWGKYGIIKDIDMWIKRPEFSAWLAEVKKVNMETLSNWEEKQMFKEYMEDYNTATFPSKKYYNLDIYHRRKMMKARMKGMAKFAKAERVDFNDEEQRRLELRKEREQKKEEDVEALMRTMQSGMAQAMREQAQLREEMQYQFRLGNVEAAQAIQRRLDPDADKLAKM